MNSPAILIENLRKNFGKLEVLKGVSFEVSKGSITALLGPNGAGKTTTVRILSTLIFPDSGKVIVNGFDVKSQSRQVRESIGLTGQYAAVDGLLSARENLIMMGRLYHLGKKRAIERAEELLREFDLLEAAERAVKTFSGGMARRLDLALSLVATPPVIFLDEPTTGLDPRSRLAVWEIVEKLKAAGITILLTTQYLEEADKLADKIVVIDHGTVIAQGTSEELKGKVGKERLELVIAEQSNFEKAVSLMKGEDAKIFQDDRKIVVNSDGALEVKRRLDILLENNIEVESLSLHRPTLDDVFLSLTGKPQE